MHALTRAGTRASSSPLSEFVEARSVAFQQRRGGSEPLQIYRSVSPRVPGSRRMWQSAMRGGGRPGARPVTMPRERCRVATVTRAAARGEAQPLVALFADAPMRAIGRGGGVLLKADRILCNGLNVVHPSCPRHPDGVTSNSRPCATSWYLSMYYIPICAGGKR